MPTVTESSLGPQALAVAKALNNFLGHFIPTGETSREQQLNHLQAVVEECAKLGYVLLSHPSDWQFVFGDQAISKTAVVCAGLDKMTRQEGDSFVSIPHRVFSPVIVQV